MKRRPVVALCFALDPVPAGKPLPERMTLVPAPAADGKVRGDDGRVWLNHNPAAVAKRFTRKRAVTENHAGHLAAPKGLPSPAFGNITAVQVESDGSISGAIAWNARGEAAIRGNEYAYLSPEFTVDESQEPHAIVAIVGASLTNTPNFPELALNSAQDETDPTEPPMSKAIARALGLNESADEASIVAAIDTIKTERATALNAAQTPDRAKFVPVAEHQVVLNRATTAEGDLKALKDKGIDDQVNSLVDEGVKAGKIVPATREYYVAMCRSQGVDTFKAFLEKQPVITAATTVAGGKQPGASAAALTPEQLATCSSMGISEEAFRKANGLAAAA